VLGSSYGRTAKDLHSGNCGSSSRWTLAMILSLNWGILKYALAKIYSTKLLSLSANDFCFNLSNTISKDL